jgi:phosphoenolpyruvate carboxylase
MKNTIIEKVFNKEVKNKFNVYNSLFLNLPYPKVSNIGMLIPLLYEVCKSGLETGKEPIEILNSFFQFSHSIKNGRRKN